MNALRTIGVCLMLAVSSIANAQGTASNNQMQLSPETREYFRNRTNPGSCVQCSIGIAGIHCNDLNAASLLWDSIYGSKVWHGSWPGRVAGYCNERGIRAYNVTGSSTIDWCKWAAKTGRFAAIGAGEAHFQTLYGYVEGDAKPWKVCNNNSPQRIDEYTDSEFKRLHYASGPWVVVLKKSSSENPELVEWWK